MFSSLTVAQRLGLGFGLILALLVLVTLFGVQRVSVMNQTFTAVNEGASQKHRHAINSRGSVHDRAIAIRDAVMVSTPQEAARHWAELERLDAIYQEAMGGMNRLLAQQASTSEEKRLLDQIRASENTTRRLSTELIELQRRGDPEATRQMLQTRVVPAYTDWLTRLNAFITYQEANVSADIETVRELAEGFGIIMVVMVVMAIAVSVAISLLIIRSIKAILGAEPHEVSEAIQKLAAGHLTVTRQTRYPDSVMGNANEMTRRLAGIIQDVREAAGRLSQASSELKRTSEDNNRQIQLQSVETEQMAAAINEMAASVSEVSLNVTGAAAATRNADQEVENGNKTVKQTAAAIQNLADTLEGAARKVQTVSQQSSDIEKIVEVISSIAEQTNLLALNAAIEAARAGEHGRGFAVVADEVRSLASRTQTSTREISSMINALQGDSGSAAEVMEASRKLAQNTVEQTLASESALERIRSEVMSITDMSTQIAAAAEQQSRVAEEVNQNINRINHSTLVSSAGSDQVAASSSELSRLSEALQHKVSYFKI